MSKVCYYPKVGREDPFQTSSFIKRLFKQVILYGSYGNIEKFNYYLVKLMPKVNNINISFILYLEAEKIIQHTSS